MLNLLVIIGIDSTQRDLDVIYGKSHEFQNVITFYQVLANQSDTEAQKDISTTSNFDAFEDEEMDDADELVGKDSEEEVEP